MAPTDDDAPQVIINILGTPAEQLWIRLWN